MHKVLDLCFLKWFSARQCSCDKIPFLKLCCAVQFPVASAMQCCVTEVSVTQLDGCSQICYVTSWFFRQGNFRRVWFGRGVINKICLPFIYEWERYFMFFLIKKQVKHMYSNSTYKFHNTWKQNQKEIPVPIGLLFYHYHLQQNKIFVFKNFCCPSSFIGPFHSDLFFSSPFITSSSFSDSSFTLVTWLKNMKIIQWIY